MLGHTHIVERKKPLQYGSEGVFCCGASTSCHFDSVSFCAFCEVKKRMTDLAPKPHYTYLQLAAAYGMSYSQISRDVSAGLLNATQLGRNKVVFEEDVDEWLAARRALTEARRSRRPSRHEQKPPKSGQRKGKYKPEAGADLLEALGLITE